MRPSSHAHVLGVAGIMVAAVLWGTTGTAATFAPDVGAAAIGAAAMGVGGLLQAALALRLILASRALLLVHWRLLAAGAIAVAIYPLAFYGSMRLAGVTIGTVISIGSAPLLSALLEWRLEGLRLSRQWMLGAATGLTGMLLLCVAGTTHGTGVATDLTSGVILGVIAGLTYATYSWSARRLMGRGVPGRASMGTTFGLGGLLLMPVLAATGAPFLDSWSNVAVGIYMAAVPMFLGYVCFGYGLARISASSATTITLFEPVVAAVLAMAIVGERLPGLGWMGIVLIMVCLVIVTIPVNFRVLYRQASRPVRRDTLLMPDETENSL